MPKVLSRLRVSLEELLVKRACLFKSLSVKRVMLLGC